MEEDEEHDDKVGALVHGLLAQPGPNRSLPMVRLALTISRAPLGMVANRVRARSGAATQSLLASPITSSLAASCTSQFVDSQYLCCRPFLPPLPPLLPPLPPFGVALEDAPLKDRSSSRGLLLERGLPVVRASSFLNLSRWLCISPAHFRERSSASCSSRSFELPVPIGGMVE